MNPAHKLFILKIRFNIILTLGTELFLSVSDWMGLSSVCAEFIGAWRRLVWEGHGAGA
jgi:hypothetical protein